jgi:undecaprenyl-diphosphatase
VTERDPNSFPSGHTSAALSCAAAWWHYLPRPWRWTAGVCAVLMGLSRLYVGVHFPTDVFCGLLVGLFCGWGGWQLEKLEVKSEK